MYDDGSWHGSVELIAILLGWPSLICAAGLALYGVWRETSTPVWIAALLCTPMALYISGLPAMPFVGAVPIVALALAAFACRFKTRWLSAFGLGIYYICLVALAYIVSRD